MIISRFAAVISSPSMRSRLRELAPLLVIPMLVVGILLFADHWQWRTEVADGAAYAPERFDTLAVLPRAVRESSGLAIALDGPDMVWTHNDSGDGPVLYAVGHDGGVRRRFLVAAADARDWEDMDAGPCPRSAAGRCLYLADFGDNARERDVLTIYLVREPGLDREGDTLRLEGRIRYRYPDARHDAEMLAVHPDGDLVVVTKGRSGSVVLYRLPPAGVAAAVAGDSVIALPPGVILPITPDGPVGRMVTGGSFSPDGTLLAVRTYIEIYFLPWPAAAMQPAIGSRCFLGRAELGGEALAWADARTLILSSEEVDGHPGILSRVVC